MKTHTHKISEVRLTYYAKLADAHAGINTVDLYPKHIHPQTVSFLDKVQLPTTT